MPTTKIKSRRKTEIDREAIKCFGLSESIDDLINAKLMRQDREPADRRYLGDIKRANRLLTEVVKILKS